MEISPHNKLLMILRNHSLHQILLGTHFHNGVHHQHHSAITNETFHADRFQYLALNPTPKIVLSVRWLLLLRRRPISIERTPI